MFKFFRFLPQRCIRWVGLALISTLFVNVLIMVQLPTPEAAFSLTHAPQLPPTRFVVPQSFQGKIISKINLKDDRKVVALTFDDGPSLNTTPQILDILRQANIKATFFWVGQNLKNHPEIAQQLVADGHAVGNHTWHHFHGVMNSFTVTHEIEDTAQIIQEMTGVKTALFRPPNRYLYNGLVDYARKRKDAIILWSVSSGDWRGPDVPVESLVNKFLRELEPGAIALMHDGEGNHRNTLQALPIIIERVTEQGYKFVTVPELLQMQQD